VTRLKKKLNSVESNRVAIKQCCGRSDIMMFKLRQINAFIDNLRGQCLEINFPYGEIMTKDYLSMRFDSNFKPDKPACRYL
jgi:hypothetical protein